jgi:DNA-binding response OmpR family regulator
LSARATIVTTSGEFHEVLDRDRPPVVLLSSPPATRADIEAVAATRARRPGLRAILITPLAASEERIRALDRGFDDALPDGISAEELVHRAVVQMRRTAARPSRSIAIGDGSVLDLVAHELRRDGRPVHLRPKEYRLLALLAVNPGRAFTRRQLLDRVWGPGPAADSRTVDVHIRWLRSKLEVDPERPTHVVTVRGTGYRLDPAAPLTG